MSESQSAPTDKTEKIPFRKLLRIVQGGKVRGKPMFRVAYQGENWPVWRTYEQLQYNRMEAQICEDYLRDNNPDTFERLVSSESEDEGDSSTPTAPCSPMDVDDGKNAPLKTDAAMDRATTHHDDKSDDEAEEPPAKKHKK